MFLISMEFSSSKKVDYKIFYTTSLFDLYILISLFYNFFHKSLLHREAWGVTHIYSVGICH